MTVAWVLGSGGLLGAALCHAIQRSEIQLFQPTERFCWTNESHFAAQLSYAVQGFADRSNDAQKWQIYWAAGVGMMGSSDADLRHETRALALLLQLIESEPRLMSKPGAIVFASSAGAIYAGTNDLIITENTPPAPTTPYAFEKLKQENLICHFVERCGNISALLARISTLYGRGQSFGKKQGLLAHIARCMLRNQPIQIYVPFDTIRDYISADDAAYCMITALCIGTDKPGILTKIIASEQPATIAEIISIFRRIERRAPRIVTSASKLSNLYSRRVQFKSVMAPKYTFAQKKTLLVGISEVMAAERTAFARSREISQQLT